MVIYHRDQQADKISDFESFLSFFFNGIFGTEIGGEWQEPETPEAEGFVYGGTASRYRCGVDDIGGLWCHLMLLNVCVGVPY